MPKLADETEFIPADLGQARLLLKALREQGTPTSQARGIVSWLLELPEDLASNQVRATYRKELARLAVPPWSPDDELWNRSPRSYPYFGRETVAAGRRGPAAALAQLEAAA